MPEPGVSVNRAGLCVFVCVRICGHLCAQVLIEFKIQPFKETHSTCGQMPFMEEDTSSKSASSKAPLQ